MQFLHAINKILGFVLTKRKTCYVFLVNSRSEERVRNNLAEKVESQYPFKTLTLKKEFENLLTIRRVSLFFRYCLGQKIIVFHCLSFRKFHKQHKTSFEFVEKLNALKIPTVCVQHGGIKISNLDGHVSSVAKYQLLWSEHALNYIQDKKGDREGLFVIGNPSFKGLDMQLTPAKILLATCLHTEYEQFSYGEELYEQFLETLAQGLSFFEIENIDILPHPYDGKDQMNLYRKYFPEATLLDRNKVGVFDALQQAKLVVSRASTIVEEAYHIQVPCLFFDVVADGPLSDCSLYEKYYGIPCLVTSDPSEIEAKAIQCMESAFEAKKGISILDFDPKKFAEAIQHIEAHCYA